MTFALGMASGGHLDSEALLKQDLPLSLSQEGQGLERVSLGQVLTLCPVCKSLTDLALALLTSKPHKENQWAGLWYLGGLVDRAELGQGTSTGSRCRMGVRSARGEGKCIF